jgi:hypothetical protein
MGAFSSIYASNVHSPFSAVLYRKGAVTKLTEIKSSLGCRAPPIIWATFRTPERRVRFFLLHYSMTLYSSQR